MAIESETRADNDDSGEMTGCIEHHAGKEADLRGAGVGRQQERDVEEQHLAGEV